MNASASFTPIDRLDGRAVLIAGGLGAVGKATAVRLAALGARVIVLHRKSGEEAKAFLSELAGSGHSEVQANITDSASLAKAAQEVQSRFGSLHILVNTAGFTRPVPAADLAGLTDELIDDIFKSNWRGVFATIRAFHPLLKASGDGLIVNISSISGSTGTGSNLAYVASKAGIDILGKSLARALAPEVRVLTVSPGVVESSFVPGRGADFNAKTAATTPLRRVGQPDDVAAAIQACATTLRFSTGQIVVVDGGRAL
jgi:3-oxoacyl-[acyl-carrier protein] reductase